MSSFSAVPISNVFNTLDYNKIIDGSLSLSEADSRYFKLIGGTISGLTSFLADVNINGALNAMQLNTNLTSSGLAWQSIAGSTTISLNHTLNGTALLGAITNSAFGFLTNNIERARILNNGNFGIGTASASYKLDVNGDINTNTIVRINKSTNGQTFNSTNGSSSCVLYHFNNGDCYFGSSTPNNLVFQTLNTARMSINGSTGAVTGISSLTATAIIATSTLEVNGVSISSADIAYLSGVTAGNATASKALVFDSNKRITDIDRINITSSNATATTGTTTSSNFALNILSTVNSNGQYNSQGIAFLNAASDAIPHGVISSVRTALAAGDIVLSTRSAANNLSENLRILSTGALSINYGSNPDAMLSCIGSSSYQSANYQRLLRLETSNVTPIQFGIHLNLNTAATTTHATYVGNLTANDLHFGTNTSAFVALKHTGSMMVIGSTTAISSTHKLEVLGSTLITDSTNSYTMPSTPAIGVMNGAHASGTRVEYQTMGKYVSSIDYSAWTTSIYYQSATQDTANYITWCPSAKTSLTSGWGLCMNRNGQVSIQDSNTAGGAGGIVTQANIIAALDVYGGVTRFIGANGALRSNASPTVYNGGGGSTRIGLFCQNAIWTADQVYASSDRRLKRNIKPVPLDEAKKLLNVQGVKYRWKKDMDGDKEVNHYGSELGVIAQDLLEQDLFRLVSYLPDEKFPLGYHYGVSYDRMTVYLLELIKDLYNQIDQLKKN